MSDIPADFESDQFLSLKQVAAILGLSVWTVNYHRSCGTLRVTRLSRNRIGIRRSELRRWIATRDADLAELVAARAERKREKTERFERWLASQGLQRIPQSGGVAA